MKHMTKIIGATIGAILLSAFAHGQQAILGNLPQNALVVTQEQDAVALSAFGQVGTIASNAVPTAYANGISESNCFTKLQINPILGSTNGALTTAFNILIEPSVVTALDGTYRMFYTRWYQVYEASAPTPVGPWSTNAFPNPTVGSGYSGWTLYAPHSKCVQINGTYYLTACSDIAVTNCFVNEFTSTDGTNFTYRGVALSPGTYDKSIESMYIWNEGGNNWWAIYESGYQFSSPSSIYSFALFLASSTNGLTWTKQNSGQPILSIAPPFGFAGHANVWKDPATSLIHCWFHGTPTNNANLTGIWHSYSADRTNWVCDAGNPVLPSGTEINPGPVQIADADVRQYGGQTYIFYDTQAAGGIGAACINAAVFPGTLGMLVSSNLGTAGNTASNSLATASLTAAKLAGDETTLAGTVSSATFNAAQATFNAAQSTNNAVNALVADASLGNTNLSARLNVIGLLASNAVTTSGATSIVSSVMATGNCATATSATTAGSATTAAALSPGTASNNLVLASTALQPAGNGSQLTGITASQVAGVLTNVVVNNVTGTVSGAVASLTIPPSVWTTLTGGVARISNTSFVISNNAYTATLQKFVEVKWLESSVSKCAMVAIPAVYSAPTCTVTMIGNVMATTPDAGSISYSLINEPFVSKFVVAGTLGNVVTNIANTFYAMEPYQVMGADIQVGTAGTTGSMTIDIWKAASTMFTSTMPTLASTVAYTSVPASANDATTLALGDAVTINTMTNQTTPAVDLYVQLYLIPTRHLTRP